MWHKVLAKHQGKITLVPTASPSSRPLFISTTALILPKPFLLLKNSTIGGVVPPLAAAVAERRRRHIDSFAFVFIDVRFDSYRSLVFRFGSFTVLGLPLDSREEAGEVTP